MTTIREMFKIARIMILGVAFSFVLGPSYGQNSSVIVNPWIKTDTTGYGVEIKRLIKKANGLAQVKLETAMMVLDSALDLIKVAPDLRKYTVYLGNRGLILVNNGRNSEATYWLERSVELASSNRWTTLERKLINVVGVNYTYRGKYDSALLLELKFLNQALMANDSVDLAIAYQNVGHVYFKLYDPNNAISFFHKTLELCDKKNIVQLFSNIGLCYNQLDKFDSALMYFELAKRRCTPECTNRDMIGYNIGKGIAFRYLGNFDSAFYYLTETYKIAEEKDDELVLAESGLMLAEVSIEMHNFSQAKAQLQEADYLCQKNSLSHTRQDVYSSFILLFERTGDIKNKASYQSKYIRQSRAVYNEKLMNKIALMEAENNEGANVKKIEDQKSLLVLQNNLTESRKKVLVLVGTIGGLLLIVSVLLIITNKKKAQINAILEHLVEDQTVDFEVSYRDALSNKDSFDHRFKVLTSSLKSQFATLKGFCWVGMAESDNSTKEVLSHVFSHINEIENLGSKVSD